MGNQKITKFSFGISLCEQYVAEFGDLKPKRTYVTEDGYPLGRWVLYQREKNNKGLLSDEEIASLNAVGMVWKLENHGSGEPFETKFNRLKNTAPHSRDFSRELGAMIINSLQTHYLYVVGC